jgi:hypothetical protein
VVPDADDASSADVTCDDARPPGRRRADLPAWRALAPFSRPLHPLHFPCTLYRGTKPNKCRIYSRVRVQGQFKWCKGPVADSDDRARASGLSPVLPGLSPVLPGLSPLCARANGAYPGKMRTEVVANTARVVTRRRAAEILQQSPRAGEGATAAARPGPPVGGIAPPGWPSAVSPRPAGRWRYRPVREDAVAAPPGATTENRTRGHNHVCRSTQDAAADGALRVRGRGGGRPHRLAFGGMGPWRAGGGAAIDDQRLPGHPGGQRGGQEQGAVGDVHRARRG